jgi:hypothetical protein
MTTEPARSLFELAAGILAARSGLSLSEARGTLRIMCHEAGLRPDLVTVRKLRVVVPRLLARELAPRRVADPDRVCRELLAALDDEKDLAPAPPEAFDMLRRVRG